MNLEELHNVVLKGELVIALFVFLALFFITAPYGRHAKNVKTFKFSARTGWIIMESPAVFVPLYFYLTSDNIMNPMSVLLIGLWLYHYIYRTFLFPFMIMNKKNSMPWFIALASIIFNSINGFLIGYGLFSVPYEFNIYTPHFMIGFILFITGAFIHRYHDKSLIYQRQAANGEYIIPKGGLFDYVVNPNYLGEIIQWFGLAVLSYNMSVLVFVIFTMSNLVPRAIKNISWYKEKFDNFPQNRKGVIPFIL